MRCYNSSGLAEYFDRSSWSPRSPGSKSQTWLRVPESHPPCASLLLVRQTSLPVCYQSVSLGVAITLSPSPADRRVSSACSRFASSSIPIHRSLRMRFTRSFVTDRSIAVSVDVLLFFLFAQPAREHRTLSIRYCALHQIVRDRILLPRTIDHGFHGRPPSFLCFYAVRGGLNCATHSALGCRVTARRSNGRQAMPTSPLAFTS